MQKSGPFFSRVWTSLKKVLIARSINMIRFLESYAVFFAKIEFPGSKGPAHLFFSLLPVEAGRVPLREAQPASDPEKPAQGRPCAFETGFEKRMANGESAQRDFHHFRCR